MKDYVDLTQLPPNRIDEMVADLNSNNIEGLRRFYEHLGLLYGYPLEQLVNVFSDDIMLNKKGLHEAFERFSYKRAVEFLRKFLDILSAENTPLSVVQELSNEISCISNDLYVTLPELISSFHQLSADTIEAIQLQNNYINDAFSKISSEIQPNVIESISFNGEEILPDENKNVDIPGITINRLGELSVYLVGYVDGKIGDIEETISENSADISALYDKKADKVALERRYAILNERINNFNDILGTKFTVLLNELIRRNEQAISGLISAFDDRVVSLEEFTKLLNSNINELSGDISDLSLIFRHETNEIKELIRTAETGIGNKIVGLSVDFSNTKQLLSLNYYTKDQTYSKDEVYNKSETFAKNEVYPKNAVYNKSETYSKDEVYPKDAIYTKDQTYSKDEVYNKSETFAKNEVYPKGAVYPKNEVYTKEEVNNFVEDRISQIPPPIIIPEGSGTSTIISIDQTIVDNLYGHINNISNPHQVNAHQVGTYTSAEIDDKISQIDLTKYAQLSDIPGEVDLTDYAKLSDILDISSMIVPRIELSSLEKIAIGLNSNAENENTIAIGVNAIASADKAIQLGEGTNTNRKTFQVFEYQVMNSSGDIEFDRLKNTLKNKIHYALEKYGIDTATDLSASSSPTEIADRINNITHALNNLFEDYLPESKRFRVTILDDDGNVVTREYVDPIFEYHTENSSGILDI